MYRTVSKYLSPLYNIYCVEIIYTWNRPPISVREPATLPPDFGFTKKNTCMSSAAEPGSSSAGESLWIDGPRPSPAMKDAEERA